jgi:excinuclease ABC subunit C
VHRFGINFHRKKRSQGTFKNELENIRGIGKNTADQLLKEFRSVKRIRELSDQELVNAVGVAKAKLIRDHFNNGGEQTNVQ